MYDEDQREILLLLLVCVHFKEADDKTHDVNM